MRASSISSGGITTFGSLIVKSFGYNSFETILFNIPFGALRKAIQSCSSAYAGPDVDCISEIISIIGSAWMAQRYQRKGLVILGTSVLPIIGTIIMLTVPREQKGVLLFGYYLVRLNSRETA